MAQHAALLLSSVTLPGGVLRRRTHEVLLTHPYGLIVAQSDN